MAYSGYCIINSIKERLLIPVADETYNTALEAAGEEASRYIDEQIRSYLSYRQTVTLKEADYVSCVRTDVGKQVLDDEVEVGLLLSYNNTTRIWKIKTTSTIAVDSELKIAGTVRGEAYAASTDDVTEAESPIFIFKTLPLSATIPDQVKVICADLGAAIFKRRNMPKDFSEGWWNQGIKKLEGFIKRNWHKGKVVFC